MRDDGVLIGTDGPFHNVLKIRPPMPFDDDDVARLVASLDAALESLIPDPSSSITNHESRIC
jgi:4-aminobutyrate aminotransferase-like enzyme